MRSYGKRGVWLLLLLSLLAFQLHVAFHHHADEKTHNDCPLCVLSLSLHLPSHPRIAILFLLFLGSLTPGKSPFPVSPSTLSFPPLRGPPKRSLLP